MWNKEGFMEKALKPLLGLIIILVSLLIGSQLGNWKGRKLQKTEDMLVCEQRLAKYEARINWLEGMVEAYDNAFEYKTVMEELGLWPKGKRKREDKR